MRVEGLKDVGEDELVDGLRPEEVEVLVVRDLLCDGVARELLQHDVDVDEAVGASPDQHDGRLDVAGGEFGDFVVLGAVRGDGARGLVVVHLEDAVADDLEPVHYALGGRVRVKVRVRGQLLVGRDVDACPAKQEAQGGVDEAHKDGRVEDRLPHGRRGQDRLASKGQVQNVGRGLDERVDGPTGDALGTHGGGQGNKHIHLLVQRWMDAQRGKSLGGALAEANVAQARLMRRLEDVVDRVRDVVKGKLVHAEVPELCVGRGHVDVLLAVLVAAVVAEPDVVAALDELKGQTALAGRQTDPDVAVHHQAVVQIDDLLAQARLARAGIDALGLLAALPAQAVQSQQVAVAGLDNVLLAVVAGEVAQLGKVAGAGNGGPHILLAVARAARRGRRELVEQAAGDAVAGVDDGRRQRQRDDGDDRLERDEHDGQHQRKVLAQVQAAEEGDAQRHGLRCCYLRR